MASQSSIEDEPKFDEFLNILLGKLSNEDDMMGQIEALNNFPVKQLGPERIDHVILKTILPPLQQSFIKTIHQINQKCAPDFASSLQFLSCVIEFVSHAVKLYGQDSCVEIEKFKNLPKTAFLIAQESLLLCKESREIFSSNANDLNDILLHFYAKIQAFIMEILNLLCHCRIDYGDERHVSALNEACEEIFPVVKIASKMDVKLMSSLWKIYMKLLGDHQATLRDRLDVASIVNFLCQEIHSSLSIIDQGLGDGKVISRAIKLGNFHLKIVFMICDKYKDYLGDCEVSLFNVLIALIKSCPPSTACQSLSDSLKDELSRCIKVGIEPLIMHLINDRNFIEVATKDGQQDIHGASLCLLYMHLLPHVVTLEDDVCKKWLVSASRGFSCDTIIMATFQAIPKCAAELRLPLYMPGVMQQGKAQRQISFYEYVCSVICGFTATLPDCYFKYLEEELLRSVLSEDMWRSLLASDVFCFVARYGSAELCFNYCIRLTEILKDSVPFLSVLARLVSRLFKFLAPSDKKRYLSEFPFQDHPSLWSRLDVGDIISVSERVRLTRHFVDDIKTWLDNPTSVQFYISMMNSLRLLARLLCSGSMEILDARHAQMHQISSQLKELCNSLWKKVNENILQSTKLTSQYLISVICLTSVLINVIPGKALLQIMYMLRRILLGQQALPVSLTIIQFLEKFICYENTSSEKLSILKLVAECYSLCLQIADCRVRQYALESFATFARKTLHESVISLCIKNNSDLQVILSQFLNKVPHDVEKAPFIAKRCLRIEPVSDDAERPAKKHKTNTESLNRIQQAIDDLKSGVSNLGEFLSCDVQLVPSMNSDLVTLSDQLLIFSKLNM